MRHQELKTQEFTVVQAPAGEIVQHHHRGEFAAPDVPASVGVALAATYVILIALLGLTIANAGEAPFMIAIDLVFLAAFFGVPFLMLRGEASGSRLVLNRFLRAGMMTNTGHVSGRGALVQMFVVPVLLIFGVLAIGTVALLS